MNNPVKIHKYGHPSDATIELEDNYVIDINGNLLDLDRKNTKQQFVLLKQISNDNSYLEILHNMNLTLYHEWYVFNFFRNFEDTISLKFKIVELPYPIKYIEHEEF